MDDQTVTISIKIEVDYEREMFLDVNEEFDEAAAVQETLDYAVDEGWSEAQVDVEYPEDRDNE